MTRTPQVLAALALIAAAMPTGAAEVRVLDVTSVPITTLVGATHGAKTTISKPSRPASAFSPAPFLTSQSGHIGVDGNLQMRCEGGSRYNFAAIQRSGDIAAEQTAEIAR